VAGSSGNGRFRVRRRRLPWPLRLVLGAAGTSGAFVLAERFLPHGHRSWQESAVQGAVQGLVVFGVIAVMIRWQGGPEAQRAAQRALRQKGIPGDVDPRLVRRGLEGMRRVGRRMRWWGTGGLAVVTGGMGALAVVGGGGSLGWVVLALALLTAGYPFLAGARLGRVDRLLAELDRRQARG
jgi:hypothetical protein